MSEPSSSPKSNTPPPLITTGVKKVPKTTSETKSKVVKGGDELHADVEYVEKEEKLTLRQEKFCQMFTMDDRELFGNGVQTYLEVYDVDRTKQNWYDTACSAASRLLRNVKIIRRIEQLLEEGGLNDQHIDKQLLFLVNQKSDFNTSLGAIKEFNKLRGRILERKDITSGGKPITIIQANYGDKDTAPVRAETISAPAPQSDGQRDEASDNSLASSLGQG